MDKDNLDNYIYGIWVPDGPCTSCGYIYENIGDFKYGICNKCGVKNSRIFLYESQFIEYIRSRKIEKILENG